VTQGTMPESTTAGIQKFPASYLTILLMS